MSSSGRPTEIARDLGLGHNIHNILEGNMDDIVAAFEKPFDSKLKCNEMSQKALNSRVFSAGGDLTISRPD